MPKRDLNRIREIMIEVSEAPSAYDDGLVEFGEHMRPGDQYQLYLMADAGLIEGRAVKEGLFFITNRGHDYLDAIRDEGIWQKTKDAVSETGGNATLEIVKTLAIGFLKKKISHHTGIEIG